MNNRKRLKRLKNVLKKDIELMKKHPATTNPQYNAYASARLKEIETELRSNK